MKYKFIIDINDIDYINYVNIYKYKLLLFDKYNLKNIYILHRYIFIIFSKRDS